MKKKHILSNVAGIAGVSSLIVVMAYFVNVLLFSSNEIVSPTDAMFIEGVGVLLIGSLLLLGRGGINLWSKKAAILSATAEAVYGAETVGPAETMRKDA